MDTASGRFRNTPSFSSTLLDEIYRSIDLQSPVSRDKNQNRFAVSNSINRCFEEDDDERRACLIQKWMENKKPVVGRRSAADLHESFWFHSRCSSTNSNSAACGGSALSDGESVMDGVPVKPRPIRTANYNKQRIMYGHEDSRPKPEHEGKFVKTKSKALKIYSELKKVKQPVSPGGRLAKFLNSLFTTGNNKKPSTAAAAATADYTEATRSRLDRKSKSANASTCSSASSFSRSCLSNTPSSRGKSSTGGEKRSVRFFPVSVIVDEDCQPCGHKSLDKEETNLNRIKFNRNYQKKKVEFEKNSRISETARSLLKDYQKKVECEFGLARDHEDQCDDGESDSSSDLFELDNLSAIRISKYQEELPVYETTRLDTVYC